MREHQRRLSVFEVVSGTGSFVSTSSLQLVYVCHFQRSCTTNAVGPILSSNELSSHPV